MLEALEKYGITSVQAYGEEGGRKESAYRELVKFENETPSYSYDDLKTAQAVVTISRGSEGTNLPSPSRKISRNRLQHQTS
jgi:hypothetical protein